MTSANKTSGMTETCSRQDTLLPNTCEKSQLTFPLIGLTGPATSFSPCSI